MLLALGKIVAGQPLEQSVKETCEPRGRRAHLSCSPIRPSNRYQGAGLEQPCTLF
jgi:hypothetical protein